MLRRSCLTLLLSFACSSLLLAQSPGDIIVSEIMMDPTDVTDPNGEWFEVFNTTDADIDLNGWRIHDNGSSGHIVDESVIVPAEGFAVICRNADPGSNGGFACDYELTFILGQTEDEIILKVDGVTIDSVAYDASAEWKTPTGASIVFTGAPGDDNNNPENWAEALEREATYYDPLNEEKDRGSPGSPGSQQSALPVELTSIEAVADGRAVMLAWATASEVNNAGFEIQHRVGTGAFEALNFVAGQGTTTEPQTYTFRAANLAPGRHTFRLKQVDFDGAFEYSPEVEVSIDLAEAFHLSNAYPNPFNPSTQFTVTVQHRQHVAVEVFNLLGQRVRTLYDGILEASEAYAFTFDAADLPSGLYLYRVTGGTFATTKQVTLLK